VRLWGIKYKINRKNFKTVCILYVYISSLYLYPYIPHGIPTDAFCGPLARSSVAGWSGKCNVVCFDLPRINGEAFIVSYHICNMHMPTQV
jgi:hypothetical protein